MFKQRLRLTHDEFAQFYGELCDVIYRDIYDVPEDGLFHTSEGARKRATAIVMRLADAGYLERR